MDNFVQLYWSMEGRISRKTWWLASIGLAVIALIIEFVVLAPLGLGMPNVAALSAADPASASAAIADSLHKAAWAGLVVSVVFGFLAMTIGIKRRHDRGNSGLDVKILYGISVLLGLLQAFGIGTTMVDAGNGISVPMPAMPLVIVGWLVGIFAIYLLVVLGFLKGTPGPNQYGADPLLTGAAAAA